VPVVKVQDFAGQPVVARDLMLIAISAPPEKRHEVLLLVEMFKGKVVDIGQRIVMVEVSGPESKRAWPGPGRSRCRDSQRPTPSPAGAPTGSLNSSASSGRRNACFPGLDTELFDRS
ncbi:MAG: hypothetical protein ACYS14_12555, partial [Planctomycetota bacterium]